MVVPAPGATTEIRCLCLEEPAQIFAAAVDDADALVSAVANVCRGLEVTVVRSASRFTGARIPRLGRKREARVSV